MEYNSRYLKEAIINFSGMLKPGVDPGIHVDFVKYIMKNIWMNTQNIETQREAC